MKRRAMMIVAALGCVAALARGADFGGPEFVNLTFDDPDLSHLRRWCPPWYSYCPPYSPYAPLEEAFRGWETSESLTDLISRFYEGLVGAGGGGVPVGLEAWGQPPFGAYIVTVAEDWMWDYARPEFSLAQVGKVPEDGGALLFYEVDGGAITPPEAPPEPVRVFVNGVQQAVVASPYGCLMVDFSPFAGQHVELKLVFPAHQDYLFDIFGFGPLPGAPTPIIIRQITASGGEVILTWTGPSSRYQVQQKAALDLPWENIGDPLTQTNWTNAVTVPVTFFRVVGLPE